MSQGGKQKFTMTEHLLGEELTPVSFNEAVDILNKKVPVLLMHEDGTVEQQEQWTDDLYNGIEAGVVDVIRFVDGKFQYYNGLGPDWTDVGGTAESEDSNGDEMVSEGGPSG